MTSDNSVEAILQEFKEDILNKVNAKECAPRLRRQGVIPENIETEIARSKDAQGILYDHLQKECTLERVKKLAEVLVGIDSGFGTTKEVGEQLQAQIRGPDAQERGSPSSEANSPSSLTSASSCSPSKLLTLIITFAVSVVVIPCAVVVVNGLPIRVPPWPFTNIWQHQMCWEDMPWTRGTSVEESRLSTATPDKLLIMSTSSVAITTDHSQPTLPNNGGDTEDAPLSTCSAATTTNHPQPSNGMDTEDVQVEKPDVKLSREELHSIQTVSEDDLVWIEIGVAGVGKSTLGNFLLGKHVFEVGGALVSVTDKAQVGCSMLGGHWMCIVDTPGFGDTHRMGTQNTEVENLANDAAHLVVELSKTMLMARHGVHAFFVVVRADSRELFSTTKLLDLLDILGNNYWNYTILVLTHGNVFDKTSEDRQYEEFEAILNSPNCPEVWKTLIEKVNKRYVIVESVDWKDDRAYHARKVKELKEHSSAIVAAHGPYNDTLHSFLKECIETAKLELHNEFEDINSPEAQIAALQVAFQNVTAMLHKQFRIKLAGGVDTELLQETDEQSKVRKKRDQLYQQLLKEQEEKRRAQEAEDRAKDALRAAEKQARVARWAEDKVRRELEEYLKKPTFEERVVKTRVYKSNFYKWQWVHSAEAEDVATGITAKAQNYQSKGGAEVHARINLKAILLERGIIRKD